MVEEKATGFDESMCQFFPAIHQYRRTALGHGAEAKPHESSSTPGAQTPATTANGMTDRESTVGSPSSPAGCSIEPTPPGHEGTAPEASAENDQLEEELRRPSPNRIWALALALQKGWTVSALHGKTRIDKWFLSKLQNINSIKNHLSELRLEDLSKSDLYYVKKYGTGDGVNTVLV